MYNLEESKIDVDANFEWIDVNYGYVNYLDEFKCQNPHLSKREAEKLDICALYDYT